MSIQAQHFDVSLMPTCVVSGMPQFHLC